MRHVALITGLLALPGLLHAQVPVGELAPDIQFKRSFNDGPKSLSDARGKVVLLDFFATW